MSVWNLGAGKKISVSSVVYNLAGDINDRPDFLRENVLSKVMSAPNSTSLGEHITSCYLGGPGMRLRNYTKWAIRSGYNGVVGMAPGDLTVGDSIDYDVLKEEIPHEPTEEVTINTANIGPADYTYWANQYVLENHPEKAFTNYVTDFNLETNVISFVFVDATTDSFTPVGYDPNGTYLYVNYSVTIAPYDEPVVPGDLVELAEGAPFPPVTGWTEVSFDTETLPLELEKKVITEITYSDARPPEGGTVITTTNPTYAETEGVYELIDYMGRHPEKDAIYSLRQIMTQWQTAEAKPGTPVIVTVNEDIGGGVIKTTKTTTTQETLLLVRSYQIDTQEKIAQEWGPAQIFIYENGSGNAALDAMFNTPTDIGLFFPIIPVRIDNQFVGAIWKPELYPFCKKAIKKSISGKYDKIVRDLNKNAQIGDIDYIYAVFGVSLNTKESDCLLYIYKFFQLIMVGSPASSIPAWIEAYDEAFAAQQAFNAWKTAQEDPGDPLYGTEAPPTLPFPDPPYGGVKIATSFRTDLNYDMTINWNGIDEETGSGEKRPGAKAGDLWTEKGGSQDFPIMVTDPETGTVTTVPFTMDGVFIHWQVTNDTWRTLKIYGLMHTNKIYGSRIIQISGHQALDDGEESGFIIPLHNEIYKEMSLVDGTQMATACCYMVMNCITIKKQKWYETIAFKILLVVLVIVVTVITAGAAGPAGAGILGANAAIGAALGFAGTAAIIVGAIANAIAAMIISQIISYASNAIFGPKIGAIVALVATVVAMNVGTAMASGASLVEGFNALMSAENLMQLTMAAGNGYAGFVQGQTAELATQYQTAMQDYERQAKEIEGLFQQNIVRDRPLLDPLTLTDVTSETIPETRDTFLTRTLLTGSDVAELSHDMLKNFVDLTVNTTLPSQ
jgi:hypothetical protein